MSSNRPLRVLTVFGTRPEAIKLAPLLLGMDERPDRFTSFVCSTGQHREMLKQALGAFPIHVHHELKLMTSGQTLAELTSRALTALDVVIDEVHPDLVMVQGDTTSTLTSALAGFYRRVPIAHVEAGLRTGDIRQPFPEEANRTLVDHLANYCFAPTERNKENLLREGVPAQRVYVTGNTGIDALLTTWNRVSGADPKSWNGRWGRAEEAITDMRRPVVLITAHRRENFGERFQSICRAIKQLASTHSECSFIYPVHLNPNIYDPSHELLCEIPNVYLIEPLEYDPFVYLLGRSLVILTDSGGIQEEAPSLGKPVLVMRDKTEREEAVQAGTVRLVGTDCEHIVDSFEEVISAADESNRHRRNPYGDGTAAKQILAILEQAIVLDSETVGEPVA